MKIGILTFHHAHNYGAVLQAYALRTYLRRQGHDVTILNYRNKAIADAYILKLPLAYRLRDFRRIRHIPKMLKSNRDTKCARSQWEVQWKRFEQFINEVILENNTAVLTADDLSKLQLDAVIAGSDQIWNPGLTNGLDSVYFLDFSTDARKIFYGASNGKGEITDRYAEYYHKTLTKCHAISTREKLLAESIAYLCKVEATHVVDPTLLLDRQDYDQLICIPNPYESNTPFVFAYFISEDKLLMEAARYISRALRLRLIELHYYKKYDLKGNDQRADFGPQEFLWHVSNASFVITNSFHGTIFALIFQKLFYSVYDIDARKDSLLESVGLERRHITKLSQIDLNDRIDFVQLQEKMNVLRTKSVCFLKSAVCEQTEEVYQ